MLVAFPCCSHDVADLKRLLQWIVKLGKNPGHDALIVADPATPFDDVLECRNIAQLSFDEAGIHSPKDSVTGWPDGCNALFRSVAEWVHTWGKEHENFRNHWLWMEPDAVPLTKDWLFVLETEIKKCHFASEAAYKFIGHIYTCEKLGFKDGTIADAQSHQVMSGIALYPWDAFTRLRLDPKCPKAWDYENADVMTAQGVHTNLIHHFWGEPNLPPVFVSEKNEHSPRNAFTLDDIPKEAVIFHRTKTPDLIRLLDRKLFPNERRVEKIAVVFPVHNGDIQQAVHHARWLVQLNVGMNRIWDHDAVISHDPSCNVLALNQLHALLKACFRSVEVHIYARPPVASYPHAANWAWASTALAMSQGNAPWFWLEADSCVLRADWLDKLQAEYERGGKDWMGSVVPHLGHLQGTSVYPPDAAKRMPRAMRAQEQAFDMEAKFDCAGEVHDASHLLFHVWSITNGPQGREACPVGGGEVPNSITAEEFRRWVPKEAVYFHRIKTNQLCDLFLTGQLP